MPGSSLVYAGYDGWSSCEALIGRSPVASDHFIALSVEVSHLRNVHAASRRCSPLSNITHWSGPEIVAWLWFSRQDLHAVVDVGEAREVPRSRVEHRDLARVEQVG